jgi:hypothetical protein
LAVVRCDDFREPPTPEVLIVVLPRTRANTCPRGIPPLDKAATRVDNRYPLGVYPEDIGEATERRAREAVIGFGRAVRGAQARRGAVALLLAVAVLLCHGLYGASHQVHRFGPEGPSQVVPPANQHHGAHSAPGVDDQGEGHAGHPDGISYAAALSVVLLAAAFALSLGGARIGARAALAADPGRRYPPSFLRSARGSPLPVLQVFRL